MRGVALAGAVLMSAGVACSGVGSRADAAADPGAAPIAVGTAGADDLARRAIGPVKRPRIHWDPISYTATRKSQMAAYSWRHYRQRTWRLTDVRQIVLHYTVSSTYSSVHNYFGSNTPSPGPGGTRSESPGVCTHFSIDKSGRIFQMVPLEVMTRHAIGLNNRSIGIEFVEESSATNILRRPAQLRAGLALVRWLQDRYGIRNGDVIGHGTANRSRFFYDRKGWYNDHNDWQAGQVQSFRRKL